MRSRRRRPAATPNDPTRTFPTSRRAVAVAVTTIALLAAACGSSGDSGPLDPAEASAQLDKFADKIDWNDEPITRSASIPPPTGANLADTLPPLDEFPITAPAPASADEVVEVWSSTEKSGQGSDGWMREVAEDFNDAHVTLSDGSVAGVDLRSIASGTGYQFIARGDELPEGFTPSNELWVQMASEFQTMTQVPRAPSRTSPGS